MLVLLKKLKGVQMIKGLYIVTLLSLLAGCSDAVKFVSVSGGQCVKAQIEGVMVDCSALNNRKYEVIYVK